MRPGDGVHPCRAVGVGVANDRGVRVGQPGEEGERVELSAKRGKPDQHGAEHDAGGAHRGGSAGDCARLGVWSRYRPSRIRNTPPQRLMTAIANNAVDCVPPDAEYAGRNDGQRDNAVCQGRYRRGHS
jgi:hypothetical protein